MENLVLPWTDCYCRSPSPPPVIYLFIIFTGVKRRDQLGSIHMKGFSLILWQDSEMNEEIVHWKALNAMTTRNNLRFIPNS